MTSTHLSRLRHSSMNKSLRFLFAPAALLTLTMCSSSRFATSDMIDLDNIYSLHQPFDGLPSPSNNQFILLVYYPKLSCTSCVNETITQVVKLSESNTVMDYVLVSSEIGFYLNNLKRVRQIKFPIFAERAEGEAGIYENSLTLFLIDAQTGKAVFKYIPRPDEAEKMTNLFLTQAVAHVAANTQ